MKFARQYFVSLTLSCILLQKDKGCVCAVYLWIIVVILSIFLLVRDGNKEVKTDNELFILPFIVSESKDCHAVAVSNIFHDFELMWTP